MKRLEESCGEGDCCAMRERGGGQRKRCHQDRGSAALAAGWLGSVGAALAARQGERSASAVFGARVGASGCGGRGEAWLGAGGGFGMLA